MLQSAVCLCYGVTAAVKLIHNSWSGLVCLSPPSLVSSSSSYPAVIFHVGHVINYFTQNALLQLVRLRIFCERRSRMRSCFDLHSRRRKWQRLDWGCRYDILKTFAFTVAKRASTVEQNVARCLSNESI